MPHKRKLYFGPHTVPQLTIPGAKRSVRDADRLAKYVSQLVVLHI